METTANIALPYIMPSQAQKHVTHNEALQQLDALVQLSVRDKSRSTPPGTASQGDRHIVASGGTGAWSGWDGDIACYVDGGWLRLAARPGWRAWVEEDGELLVYDGGWAVLWGSNVKFGTLGVNATADATNRLSIASPASLFNHDGKGHQIVVNKSTPGETASVLFQTGFSGRAEIGTAGDDRLHVKLSTDGATWRNVLTINGDDGKIAVGDNALNYSALNIKGRALTGSADSWFGITVTQTTTNNTAKGGAVLSGAPYSNADKPFIVLGPWAESNSSRVFYGGGGWGCPDATRHTFYAGAHQPTVDSGSTVAFDITATGILCNRLVQPQSDNTYSLGTSGFRWSVVYATTGTINTSDRRMKEDVKPAALGLAFVRDLEAVSYRWKVGGYDVVQERVIDPAPKGEIPAEITVDTPIPRPGGRTHYGLIAQQVKATLDAHGVADFAGWTLADKQDPDSEQGLRYDQFVPILVKAVQELAGELEELRRAR